MQFRNRSQHRLLTCYSFSNPLLVASHALDLCFFAFLGTGLGLNRIRTLTRWVTLLGHLFWLGMVRFISPLPILHFHHNMARISIGEMSWDPAWRKHAFSQYLSPHLSTGGLFHQVRKIQSWLWYFCFHHGRNCVWVVACCSCYRSLSMLTNVVFCHFTLMTCFSHA